MISGVSQVTLAVEDRQRARDFWTSKMGFEIHTDEPYGDGRWLEVAPPDGGPLLVLTPRPEDQPAPPAKTRCRARPSSSAATTSREPTGS